MALTTTIIILYFILSNKNNIWAEKTHRLDWETNGVTATHMMVEFGNRGLMR